MVSYEINADKPIYMTNTTFDTIRNIESRNWNRRLSPRNMSIIYELIDVWHRRIDSTIQMLSSNTPTTDNHPDSNGIYQCDIQDNIGTVKYQYIMDEEGNSALFIVHICFNLPWNLGVGRLSIIENKQYNTMKNTRKKVRLTESQLHQVIKESVRKVLSELDWKTYQSAIDSVSNNPKYKSKYGNLMANQEPLKSFADARNKAFNDKYGSHNTHDSYGSDYYVGNTNIDYGMEGNAYYPKTVMRTKGVTGDKTISYTSGNEYTDDEFPLGYFTNNGHEYGVSNPRYMFGSEGYMQRNDPSDRYVHDDGMEKGNEDLYNMTRGKMEYTKGKGWHLK